VTKEEYTRKLDELDRLINDPDTPMDPSRVWSLLSEVMRQDFGATLSAAAPREM